MKDQFLFIISGLSGTGKDTIVNLIKEYLSFSNNLSFNFPIPHTTRPIRDGETNGVEYIFDSKETFESYNKNEFIDLRRYSVFYKDQQDYWYYYYLKKDFIESDRKNHILIGTNETYANFTNKKCEEFDPTIKYIYISTDGDKRLLRLIKRESLQKTPNLKELIRRIEKDTDPKIKEPDLIVYNNDNILSALTDVFTYIEKVITENNIKEFMLSNYYDMIFSN